MSRVIGVVPARAASEAIPGKNMKLLGGEHLVAWTLASAIGVCDAIIVSSDCDAMLEFAEHYPDVWDSDRLRTTVVCHKRPALLATGRVPDLPVALDAYGAIDQEPDDLILLLRPTAPFRRPDEIRAVAALLRENLSDSVRSVLPAREPPQKAYLHAGECVLPEGRGRYPLLEPATGPRHRANHPRQWLPKAWKASGFIDAVRADVLVGSGSLEGDVILGWESPAERSLDLDSERDFSEAEALAVSRGWKPGEIT